MTRQFEIELKAHPAEARRARVSTRAQLQQWGLDDVVDTAELLVAELVSNAVIHTTTHAHLRISYSRTLRLEVVDASTVAPRLRHATPDDIGGRGLELIGAMSDRWDWYETADGKAVWCEVALPATAAA